MCRWHSQLSGRRDYSRPCSELHFFGNTIWCRLCLQFPPWQWWIWTTCSQTDQNLVRDLSHTGKQKNRKWTLRHDRSKHTVSWEDERHHLSVCVSSVTTPPVAGLGWWLNVYQPWKRLLVITWTSWSVWHILLLELTERQFWGTLADVCMSMKASQM